jgi:hypothetical protein
MDFEVISHYGSLETDRGIFVYQEAGPECAAYAMDAVYARDQPDFHFHVPDRDHYPAAKTFRFQKTLGGGRLAVKEQPVARSS